jgi:ankyrin repeat protein
LVQRIFAVVALTLAWPAPSVAEQEPAPASAASEALIEAANIGDKDEVVRLLAQGVGSEVTDWAGWTPISWAALRLQNDIIRVLVSAGAKVDVIARSGKNSGTPLMLAARRKNGAATVALLLELGAKVEGTDQYGRTALMMAARQGEVENMRLLLDAGADPNTVADLPRGNTALKLARRGGHDDAVRMLFEAGAEEKGSWTTEFPIQPLLVAEGFWERLIIAPHDGSMIARRSTPSFRAYWFVPLPSSLLVWGDL